ncbi:MAG: thiamine pyrophosphate-dependent enzyme [Nitrososphaerota archaeon]
MGQASSVFDRSKPKWCPGCGNFVVYSCLKDALEELGYRPEEIVVVCGIGCATFIWSYLNTNSLKALHGRVLPAATGVKLVKPSLKVLAVSGDGDAYSIGCGHLTHTARRNIDLTYIVIDNGIFGNTRGQPSPTTPYLSPTKISPRGWPEKPVDPLLLVAVSGATFIAQGYVGNPSSLREIFKKALKHRGFSLVNIVSVCPTFNPKRTITTIKEKILDVGLDSQRDLDEAVKLLLEARKAGKIPVGVIYSRDEPTYNDLLNANSDQKSIVPDLRVLEIALREFGLEIEC